MAHASMRDFQTGRADRRHEDRCRRCGISCHLALPVGGMPVVVPSLRCRFLVAEGEGRWSCSVYAERFSRAPWCHHTQSAAPLGFLARDCPYGLEAGVRYGKIRLREPLLSRTWPALLAEVRRLGVPPHIDRAAFLAEVEAREGGTWRLVARDAADDTLDLLREEGT